MGKPLVETPGPEPDAPLAGVMLAVGVIVGTHGTNGELKLKLSTDDPEHLRSIKQLFLGDERRPARLMAIRFHAGMALIHLAGVTGRRQGDELRGTIVRIAGRDARPLEPGEFYLYQVIGLQAVDERGADVGVVTDIMETGANDVLVLKPAGEGKEILLPNHPEFVLDLDPTQRRLVVRLPRYFDEA